MHGSMHVSGTRSWKKPGGGPELLYAREPDAVDHSTIEVE
jgi:hypothetical protein